MKKKKISFIVLTWNSICYIEGCLKSIDKLKDIINIEIVIVDNGSRDNTLKKVFDFKKNSNYTIKIISLDRNLGTTVTRNMAIKKSSGELLVFLDSDVEFHEENFIDMVNYLNNNDDIGILAPLIMLSNTLPQQSCKKFPTLDVKLYKLIDIFTFFSSSNRDYYDNFPFESPTYVDTAISAFWLIERKTINLIGYFDENIFYSPEDIDYCLRVWLAGKKVCFFPDFKILHYTQQITHKFPFKFISLTHLRDLLYYFIKHRYLLRKSKVYNQIKSKAL